MKARFLLLIVLIFTVCKVGSVTNSVKDVILNSHDQTSKRSLVPTVIPATAYTDGTILYVNFTKEVKEVNVSVRNLVTGQSTIVSEFLTPQSISIPLDELESGTCQLDMNIDGLKVFGEFEL